MGSNQKPTNKIALLISGWIPSPALPSPLSLPWGSPTIATFGLSSGGEGERLLQELTATTVQASLVRVSELLLLLLSKRSPVHKRKFGQNRECKKFRQPLCQRYDFVAFDTYLTFDGLIHQMDSLSNALEMRWEFESYHVSRLMAGEK